MLKVEEKVVKLGVTVNSKEEAIKKAGELLVDAGYIEKGYVDSLFKREEISNTYLGNGICIPHGVQEDRDLILKTGISVLQIPQGISWKDDEKATLIIAIAAKSDEHIDILSQLTTLLMDDKKAKHLSSTKNISDILDLLNNSEESKKDDIKAEDFDIKKEIIFKNESGFHARPATKFVDVADNFKSEIQIRFKNKTANAKSVAQILSLGITNNSKLVISALGEDASLAVEKLAKIIEEELEEEAPDIFEAKVEKRDFKGLKYEGIPASPGVVIAPITIFEDDEIKIEERGEDLYKEQNRLKEAIKKASDELNSWVRKKHEKIDKKNMEIFLAHLSILKDPELQKKALDSIQEGESAQKYWWKTIQDEASKLSNLDDVRLSQRAIDIIDVGKRVLKILDSNSIISHNIKIDEPSILIAYDMTPSQTANLDSNKVVALVTVRGGSTSHTAILARSMGIPSIAGIDEKALKIESKKAIVDGQNGVLVYAPETEDINIAKEIQKKEKIQKKLEFDARFKPAVTKDNIRIEVVANIADSNSAFDAIELGAEGVGLMRTEFLFLKRNNAPKEIEQFQAYKKMAKDLNGLPLIIRTLDIGGDKEVAYLNMPKEDNPFLGIRGIRLCLENKELFKEQLRAIYQASKYGDVKIMFPMISLIEEFKEAVKIAEEIRKEVGAEPIDIGMMIEVPSAVLLAKEFAKEAKFFSIGTNDLTQYTLCMDRGHQGLARKADALHPAVLKLIKMSCDAAKGEKRWVGVCGNLATNPLAAKILIGLGVNELSVAAASVPNIKAIIREITFKECEELANKALNMSSAAEVRALE
ncbi:phosphoenolpyruvate--protein phosphotransferase [Halarcobacter ebronensis]|nr:phosphoenolpyruvate--protein phosphotransferase [Halarcobacter ebronensis]